MKKNWSKIILIGAFLIGLSLLLYPTASNFINQRNQTKAISSYDENISKLKQEDFSKYWQEAVQYNKSLKSDSITEFPDSDKEKYNKVLNPTGNGIMGYIEITKIGVRMPIYHGTGEELLQIAIGHIEGTSLPVGGPSTHCVVSGHRGLPSAKLFSDLDQMVIGDVFQLHILGQVLAYQVDQIVTVLPDDIKDLKIVEGKDYCSFVTCTPYGINSHRLLIRGTRVDYNEKLSIKVSPDGKKVAPLLVAPAVAIPILIILLIWVMVSTRSKNSKKKK
jgi:sortase A